MENALAMEGKTEQKGLKLEDIHSLSIYNTVHYPGVIICMRYQAGTDISQSVHPTHSSIRHNMY